MGTMAISIGISSISLSSFVLSIELNFLLNVTQALFVTRRCHQLTCTPHTPAAKDPSHSMKSSVIALALQAISSAVVIPTSPSLPCATSSNELSEVSPRSLLETQTTSLDIHLHRAICADVDNLAGCHVWCAPH